jgi:membrane protein implicated in regulation of membrane protease activity
VRSLITQTLIACGLYFAAAIALLGAYLAALAALAYAMVNAWGWPVGLLITATCLALTALIAILGARYASSRVGHGSTSTASIQSSQHLEAHTVRDEIPGQEHDAASRVERIGHAITEWLNSNAVLTGLSVALAAITIIGPLRLIRMAVRAARIASTLRAIAQTASPNPRGDA